MPLVRSYFVCKRCSACCLAVGCAFLSGEGLCSIYEERPMVCRVDEAALFYGFDPVRWAAVNTAACGLLNSPENGVWDSSLLVGYCPTDSFFDSLVSQGVIKSVG